MTKRDFKAHPKHRHKASFEHMVRRGHISERLYRLLTELPHIMFASLSSDSEAKNYVPVKVKVDDDVKK